jgi:diguanylate cyclase (GGDEF)-like protein/PAS domain S-box-containing protein
MGVGQLREGEHASLFYDRPAELLESLIPAVREALASREQCIYLADELTAAHVTSALSATVDVCEARDRGALRLVTQRDGFCPTGTFRTGEMAAFLERSITDGLADGFPGVVVAEDVAWVLGPEARLEEVAAHEELVKSLVAGHPVTAICQYAAPHVPPSVARMALGLHPVVRIPLTDATDVGAVRERGRAIAEPLGFAPGDLTLMWTVISELARNVVERGLRGELILRRLEREHRLGMCVTVRVEQAGLTPTDLLPVLPEVGPLLDECETLSGADRGVIMSITKWVRDHPSAREGRLALPSWKRETDVPRGSDVRPLSPAPYADAGGQQLQREELVDFFDNAPVALHWVAEDGRILWANRAELELLGYSSEEYIGRNIAEFHADADVIADILRRLSRHETVHNYEARLLRRDGSIRHVLITSNVFWENGKFVHTRCFTRDITERKAAEEALRRDEHRRVLAHWIRDYAIFMLDSNGHVMTWNTGNRLLKGYTDEEILGRHFSCFYTSEDRQAGVPERILRLAREQGRVEEQGWRLRKDGTRFWADVVVTAVPDKGGQVRGFVKITRDLTERMLAHRALRMANEGLESQVAERTQQLQASLEEKEQLLAEVRNLTLRDELTGLYNRRGFLTLATQHLKFARRTKQGCWLIVVDMDDFKQINDTFGHPEGDQALVTTAGILTRSFRESDIVARPGGDEFAVLAVHAEDDSGSTITKRLAETLSQYNGQAGRRYALAFSVGVVRFDPTSPCSIEELFTRADEALYAQKRRKAPPA